MKVWIIEDEALAAERLEQMILKVLPQATIETVLDSISATLSYLQRHPAPDLCFMDIQLADGLSFRIFEQTSLSCPIIFTTAYDEYAIRAFKVNSIDYLLKPLDQESLNKALEKFLRLHPSDFSQVLTPQVLALLLASVKAPKVYKTRFVVRKGERLLSISTEEILYFCSEEGLTLFLTKEGKRYMLDTTLNELEEQLEPNVFFLLTRAYIVRHSAIVDVLSYSNSRLRILLKFSTDKDIIVSRERVGPFKIWLGA